MKEFPDDYSVLVDPGWPRISWNQKFTNRFWQNLQHITDDIKVSVFFFFLLICRNFNISSQIDLSRVIQVRLEFRVVDRFWWNIQHNSEMTQWQLQSEWILEPILQNLQISLWINWSRKIQNRLDSKVVFRFSGILQLRNQVTWIVDEFCNLSGSTSNIILCWVVDWSEMIQNRFWWNFCNITKNRLITEWMNFGTCCE